jgi:sulfatase maturation enzyme AslB (radical SAM superfamily)
MNLKKLAYRFKYKYAKHLNLKAPVDVTLELSSKCNHACAYCYHAENPLPFDRGFMIEATAKRILDQAAALKVPSVKFNWRGESILNPDFYVISLYAKNLGFIDRISNSNFNFPTDRTDIFRAFRNQTKIKISFDSFDKQVFEHQRKGSNFDRILENIDIFYHVYRSPQNEMIIQMVRTKLNEKEDLESIAKTRWPDAKISVRNCVSNRSNGAENLGNEMPKNRVACYQAFSRLIFDHKGFATCCCPDIKNYFNFGNIWDRDLINIWNNYRLKLLQKNLKSGKAFEIYGPCKNCSSLESYEGYNYNWES